MPSRPREARPTPALRTLVLVLGDQLDADSAAFDGFDPARDAVLMLELREEATCVAQHRLRVAFFFAAMRHFRDEQRARGRTVHYAALDDPGNAHAFLPEIRRWVARLRPAAIVVLEPGDWRVRAALEQLDPDPEVREDRHFLCSTTQFQGFLKAHPRPIMEGFYRHMRREHGILMRGAEPVGGAWNFDHDNRAPLGRAAPPVPPTRGFAPDGTTREVLALVTRALPDAPGRLDGFDLPVTRAQALQALDAFVLERLPNFGRYQDAMRGGEPFLFHAMISGPLNLHLLNPAEVVEAALANPGDAPLNAVEGFVRQVLGWREFVRGIYWQHMPAYAERNALDAQLPMPRFYWTGETDMRCLREAIAHTIEHAYAHHIERLMVLGLFALLLGVHPLAVHHWHMSMFRDAIDWVSLPNTLGMSQYGDGGTMATKPYVASGNYIDRMSDHCRHCRYDPRQALGETACPFTTLYWDFLARHRARFAANVRMRQQYANLARKDPDEVAAIGREAERLRYSFG